MCFLEALIDHSYYRSLLRNITTLSRHRITLAVKRVYPSHTYYICQDLYTLTLLISPNSGRRVGLAQGREGGGERREGKELREEKERVKELRVTRDLPRQARGHG